MRSAGPPSSTYSGGASTAALRSCQTITPSEPQTPAAKHSGEADAGRVEQGAVVRQLHEVADVLARRCAPTSTTAASRKGVVTSETSAVPGPLLADAVERLVRLDLNGQVALTVPHEQIGLADPVRLVVDREPAARR